MSLSPHRATRDPSHRSTGRLIRQCRRRRRTARSTKLGPGPRPSPGPHGSTQGRVAVGTASPGTNSLHGAAERGQARPIPPDRSMLDLPCKSGPSLELFEEEKRDYNHVPLRVRGRQSRQQRGTHSTSGGNLSHLTMARDGCWRVTFPCRRRRCCRAASDGSSRSVFPSSCPRLGHLGV